VSLSYGETHMIIRLLVWLSASV